MRKTLKALSNALGSPSAAPPPAARLRPAPRPASRLRLAKLAREVLDDRVAEQARAHLVHAAVRLLGTEAVQLHVHDLADAHVLHLVEAQTGERPLHGGALRVQDR